MESGKTRRGRSLGNTNMPGQGGKEQQMGKAEQEERQKGNQEAAPPPNHGERPVVLM